MAKYLNSADKNIQTKWSANVNKSLQVPKYGRNATAQGWQECKLLAHVHTMWNDWTSALRGGGVGVFKYT